MKVNIKTWTPIWTGGVESGKCDRIHETSIIGSLRWWMEVLVRGMGGQVYDPTSENSSDFNAKKYKESEILDPRQRLRDAGLLCDVSQIFGTTGWKRRFRLDLVEDNTCSDDTVSPQIELSSYQYEYKDKYGKTKTGTPKWWFPENLKDKPKSGEFSLNIESLDPNFNPDVIRGLIQFIADWSALGARSQMGFGVIEILGDRISMQPLYEWLIGISGQETYRDLPSLQNIFLAKIQTKDANFDEEKTFNLKYDLRQLFRSDKNLRHFIMGTTKGNIIAAKVKISRFYYEKGNKNIRVWGWIPETAAHVYNDNWKREKIVAKIYEHLDNKYELIDWCEMKSPRDSVTKKQDNPQDFLHSLLKL